MTREEAIKTIEIAIAEVEWEYPMDYAVAFEMAIDALRAQAEAERNDPLTVEELREMDGEPIYLLTDEYPGDTGWTICYGIGADGYINTLHGYFTIEVFAQGTVKAYLRKPEEGTK